MYATQQTPTQAQRNGAKKRVPTQMGESQNMFPGRYQEFVASALTGQVQGGSQVQAAPQGAVSGTPTVVMPPTWVGKVPIPMHAIQQQAMGYKFILNLSGSLQDNNGYHVMPDGNWFSQQNSGSPPHFQPEQKFDFNAFAQQVQNQANEGQVNQWGYPQDHQDFPNQLGNMSTSSRRRHRRRRAKDAAKAAWEESGSNAVQVSSNRSPMNGLASHGNQALKNGHMANEKAKPEVPEVVPDGELLVGDPHILALNSDLANEALELLEGGTREKKHEFLQWIMPDTLGLALSASGCRVVQAAVEVAGGEHRSQMMKNMHGHVADLLDSPHGNHVLQKCIEVLPPDIMQFVLSELGAFPDGGLSIAKHRFGCRIFERLLEHCPVEQTKDLVEGVIENAHALCRHPFGNYVVQHVLEYGALTQRNAVLEALLQGGVMQLAMHRVASNVIEKALVQCPAEGRRALVEQLVADPAATLTMAGSRYGSFIAQRLLELPVGPQRDEVWKQLSEGLETLKASNHSKEIVAIIEPEEAETQSGPESGQIEQDGGLNGLS